MEEMRVVPFGNLLLYRLWNDNLVFPSDQVVCLVREPKLCFDVWRTFLVRGQLLL